MSKVSIVLPVYNGEKYLEKSIQSIINQTYQDWELIIVNDCSKDGSVAIAEKFLEKDDRIRLVHNEVNKKLPGTLNVGFSLAKGEYLTWTSDDNLYLPNAIEEMVNVLDSNPNTYMVRADMKYIDADDNVIGESEAYSDDKMYDYNCLGACFMYKRDVISTVGGYAEDTFCVEDYDYWLRILEQYHHIESIDKILYLYRRHDASLSTMKQAKVAYQLAILRCRHIDNIFMRYEKDKSLLTRIYYEMLRANYMPIEVRRKFESAVPELRGERDLSQGERLVAFGAGVYGINLLKDSKYQVEYFIDNNKSKLENCVEGIVIKSFDDYLEAEDKPPVMITVAPRNIYSIIAQLFENGIKEFSVFKE